MFRTKLTKEENAYYYSVNDGSTVFQFIHDKNPKASDKTSSHTDTIHVNYIMIDTTGGLYEDWAGIFSRDSKNAKFGFWANGSCEASGKTPKDSIKRFLGGFDNPQKIEEKNIENYIENFVKANKKTLSQSIKKQEKLETKRAKINILTKINKKDAKKIASRFTDIYYADNQCLLGVSKPKKGESQIAPFHLIELNYNGKHEENQLGAYVKGGWHSHYYEERGLENPNKDKWVWVFDGEEQPERTTKTLGQGITKFLKEGFNNYKKIDNFEDYVQNRKDEDKFRKNNTKNPGRDI